MTTVKAKLRKLEERRKDAALFGGVIGGVGGLVLSLDFLVSLFAGAAVSVVFWYFASLEYWDYRDSVTLHGRNK